MTKQFVSKAVGIDLGTTNSAVAIMNRTDTEIIIHKDARTRRETTPSCVWKDPRTHQIVVGSKAFQRIGTTPEPIRSIKRLMGQQTQVRLSDELLTPEQVSALILSEMKRQIEEDAAALSTDDTTWIVDRAIVTVPAYFDQPQIEATRKAAEIAGLQVLELLHEPTAAASYYCWQNQVQNGVFLVYDFGGGTFDVSILRCTEGSFEVLGISGNNRLGGDDIDATLAEELRQRLITEGYELDLDVKNDPEDRHRFEKLKLLAEGVKKALSTADEFILRSQSNLYDKNGLPVNIDIPFEIGDFEKLIQPIVERTIPYCHQALDLARQKAGITLADVDAIILAGGTTHIPLVRELVRKHFCQDPAINEPRAKCTEPVYKKVDTIVALGAEIRAAATGGLVIYDEQRSIRALFRGISATSSKQINIGGTIEALKPGIDLTGGFIRLTIANVSFDDEQELKNGGIFGFTRVPLQPGIENQLVFEIFDSSGTPLARLHRTIYQSQDALRPTGGSVGTALLSKSIYLEVSRDGKPYRKELIKALSALPASKEDVFSHPGDTTRLRLPLYQNKKKIKEIVVDDLPLLPKGTPVRFTLHVDELASITVRGNVSDKTFEMHIDPPPKRDLPRENEVLALDEAFQNIAPRLSDSRQHIADQYQKARRSYEEALKREEIEQAIHDFEEMEELIESNKPVEQQLEPPVEVFEELIQDCNEINRLLDAYFAQHGQRPHNYNGPDMQHEIEKQKRKGEQAIVAHDQVSYADVLVALHAIRDHLGIVYGQIVENPETLTEPERAARQIRYALLDADEIEQLARAKKQSDVQNEIILLRNQLNASTRDLQSNPLLVLRRVAQVRARLQQIKTMVMNAKAVGSSIGELVEDISADDAKRRTQE
ncbi:molecular chaperone DnaK (HSP70) [Thermosporothrix hazakensis]|jgi:molecular chaperone DnaK|uniref:Molecular chaperone DnaK (HSP70) n=1 Tax=Thermosporothrix hazakensis TaxID=644383 RepID=A0A326U4N0_THEHA|nr:Hsp70 family protein [Thermosporothrix hazakensis]PZW27992.1 molecular chaperone DnaK (HSP70) [Thermosporothrix hazakensis]GCE51215.1 hypothetical protein KTH_60840 [Thermosporothrix hazakensis]